MRETSDTGNVKSKPCPKCGECDLANFHKSNTLVSGHSCYCKKCTKDVKQTPGYKKSLLEFRRGWKNSHLDEAVFLGVQSTARRNGTEFTITRADVKVPEKCPVLGIPLFFTNGTRTDNTPSLDRLDNGKGYIPGNVAVISWRANQIKRDATLTEIKALALYMESR